jgi:hypothetical protein
VWSGCLALNNANLGMRIEADVMNASVQDCAFWDNANGGIAFGGSGTNTATMTRVTIGRTKMAASGDFMGGIGAWNSGAKSASSVRFYNYPNGLSQGVSVTGTVTGLPTYLPQQLGGIGGNLTTMIGTTGALVGDAGWNLDTGVNLWPWPNEVRLKKEMCTDAGITRGFCAAASLSNYIWGYLGNASPF